MGRNRKTQAKATLSNKAKKKLLAEAKQRKQQEKSVSLVDQRRNRAEQQVWQAQESLRLRRKISKNAAQTIEAIFRGEIEKVPFDSKFRKIKQVADHCRRDAQRRQAAKQLCLILEENKSKVFECPEASLYGTAISALAAVKDEWIRNPETWKCKTKNTHRQFRSLLRHLLAKYEVPLFMDDVWNGGNSTRISWWIHVGKGGNIRKANHLPISLTKKMAHHMMQAPSNYTVDEAFRWGQIHALGGNQRTVSGILSTFLVQGYFQNNDFWASVIRFFIDNPMLDTAQYGPVIDYLRNQKFITPEGADNPPQPNLSMKDRQADALLRQVEDWHNVLARINKKRSKRPTSWDHHEIIEDFSRKEGKKEKPVIYKIVQLLTASDLATEGRRLNHCVGSYAWSCSNGQTSIWSIRRMQPGDAWDCLGTVELRNQNKTITQFKAKRNMKPSTKAHNLMELWARKWGIRISSWL